MSKTWKDVKDRGSWRKSNDRRHRRDKTKKGVDASGDIPLPVSGSLGAAIRHHFLGGQHKGGDHD